MAGEERSRVTFAKIPSLKELIFARMPQWRFSLKPEALELASIAEKVKEFWAQKDELPFNKRYVVGDKAALGFMEKKFGVEEKMHVSYRRKNLLIGFSEDGDWYKIFTGEIMLTSKSILLLDKVDISKISSQDGEKYGLFSIRFTFRGATEEHGKVSSGIVALLTSGELAELKHLFIASQK
jgi:hypothetical protein